MFCQGIEPLALSSSQNDRKSVLNNRARSGRNSFQRFFLNVALLVRTRHHEHHIALLMQFQSLTFSCPWLSDKH